MEPMTLDDAKKWADGYRPLDPTAGADEEACVVLADALTTAEHDRDAYKARLDATIAAGNATFAKYAQASVALEAAEARIAALEAALREVERIAEDWRDPDSPRGMADADAVAERALSGGTAALDAHVVAAVAKAVADERKRCREALRRDVPTWNDGACSMADVLAALAAKGGAS